MVDKIPWDTCVVAWIICVLKTEFEKALLSFSAPPPSPTQYNVETVEKLHVHVSNIVGGVGGGAE